MIILILFRSMFSQTILAKRLMHNWTSWLTHYRQVKCTGIITNYLVCGGQLYMPEHMKLEVPLNVAGLLRLVSGREITSVYFAERFLLPASTRLTIALNFHLYIPLIYALHFIYYATAIIGDFTIQRSFLYNWWISINNWEIFSIIPADLVQ